MLVLTLPFVAFVAARALVELYWRFDCFREKTSDVKGVMM
jgi:hypothetical protein